MSVELKKLIEGALLLLQLLFVIINAKPGFGPGEQDWGHVKVREGAHMFFWLYYTTASVQNYTERPLVIWLQGGPGGSAAGYGNFGELGPLTLDLEHRNHTWVQDVNVMFIDNPVGTGFSYVASYKYLTKTNKEIALDLVEFMKKFYQNHPEFREVPLHIFSESYGGKMASEFALELYKAKQQGKIKTNLKSVALGNSWISPMDSVDSWAPLLLNMGIIDLNGYRMIENATEELSAVMKKGLLEESAVLCSQIQRLIVAKTENVNTYNILKPTKRNLMTPYSNDDFKSIKYRSRMRFSVEEDTNKLVELMRGPVSKALNIPEHIVWSHFNEVVFITLEGDFMRPVIHIVEELLNKTDIEVVVFSGQLELISSTPGTVNWIDKMHWPLKTKYDQSPRLGYAVNGILEGFEKHKGKFSMYWVYRAGHMVPEDNPGAMAYILKSVTKHGKN